MAVSLVSTGVTFPDNSTQTTAATDFGFKNRIINGAMVIDQRNAGASVTLTADLYTVDRFLARTSSATNSTAQRSTTAPSGFNNSLLVTIGTGASPASSASNAIRQEIEGFNVADLGWGTASAKTVTISFWVRSSLTGTFGGALSNAGLNRAYPYTYSISAANTWEYKTVIIPGDTSGTWATDNSTGIRFWIDLGSGTNIQGTAGSWGAADYRAASGCVQLVATSGATFYITGVQLEKGSTATSFDYRPYGTELQLAQRYYEKSFDTDIAATSANAAAGAYGQFTTSGSAGGLTTAYLDGWVPLKVVKRGSPTVTVFDAAGNSGVCTRVNPGILATNNQAFGYASQGYSSFTVTSSSAANAGRFAFYWVASSEL